MCELCQGNHVVHKNHRSFTEFITCPNCGPIDESIWFDSMNQVREKIALAKEKLKEKAYDSIPD